MPEELSKWCEFERRITLLEANSQNIINQLEQIRQDTFTRFENAAKTFNEISQRLTQLENRRP